MSLTDDKQRRSNDREQELIRIAEVVIAKHGFMGLSIDKIAARFELSRPTIYQHFGNKADVLCAVATEVLEREWRACEHAIPHTTTPRERILTTIVAFSTVTRRYPSMIALSAVLHDRLMMKRVSVERRERLSALRAKIHAKAVGFVRDAIDAGDLPADSDPASVMLPLWAMMVGGSAVVADPLGDWRSRVERPDEAYYRGVHTLLNGLGWRPIVELDQVDGVTEPIDRRVREQIEAEFGHVQPDE
ncbi:MAG: TetR/AcrR family transcriptional regulator [Phycisphaerales bacterium]